MARLKDNFFNYVNKEWVDNTIIPDEYNKWGQFKILQKETNEKINNLLLYDNSIVGLFYKQALQCNMNTNDFNIELLNLFINYIKSSDNIHRLFKRTIKLNFKFNIPLPLDWSVGPSYLNSKQNILHISSNGLGLPDRDYYFLPEKEEIRNKYLDFIKEYSENLNDYMVKGYFFPISIKQNIINIDPITIFNLEKQLAEKTFTSEQDRDSTIKNNMTTWDDIIISYPNITFIKKIFKKAKKKPQEINIMNIKYVEMLNNIIDIVPLDTWKQYFIWHTILCFNNVLSNRILECHFNFYNKIILGTKKMKPLWERTFILTESYLGELVGKLYVKKYSNVNMKETVENMIFYIKMELKNYIQSNSWMENNTKIKAIEKLDKMKIKIGYPEKLIKKYHKLHLPTTNQFLHNIIKINDFHLYYELKKLYMPVDTYEWSMYAHEVNAYYSPDQNEIVFPAGILQEPFFFINNISASFGGIGSVIGHEIIHGFDDDGSKYDSDGNLKNWWTDNDFKKYKIQTQNIKEQYDNHDIIGQKLNGQLTLGENIADIGGIALSFKAMEKYCKDKNITMDKKQFFISYANIWKSKARNEYILHSILTDPHSPPLWRVNGALPNVKSFYETFDITINDIMYLPENKRADIWGSNI